MGLKLDKSFPMATTVPVEEESVFRGLLKFGVEEGAPTPPPGVPSGPLADTAWQTAGRSPASVAGLGLLVRCQSW